MKSDRDLAINFDEWLRSRLDKLRPIQPPRIEVAQPPRTEVARENREVRALSIAIRAGPALCGAPPSTTARKLDSGGRDARPKYPHRE